LTVAAALGRAKSFVKISRGALSIIRPPSAGKLILRGRTADNIEQMY
jgi:hypothetical protein